MTEIILQAVDNCCLRRGRGISLQRGRFLWDDQLTPQEKGKDIAEELTAMGYDLLRAKEKPAKEKGIIQKL